MVASALGNLSHCRSCCRNLSAYHQSTALTESKEVSVAEEPINVLVVVPLDDEQVKALEAGMDKICAGLLKPAG